MKLYLSRQHNDLYMLTKLKPIKAKVLGTDHEDLYTAPGEPIGIRNLCEVILKLAQVTSIQPLQSIKINLTGEVIPESTNPF